jgi:hypothetical protein
VVLRRERHYPDVDSCQFNVLIAFEVIEFTQTQVGAINALVAALLGVITRQVVTPLADPRNNAGERLVPQSG